MHNTASIQPDASYYYQSNPKSFPFHRPTNVWGLQFIHNLRVLVSHFFTKTQCFLSTPRTHHTLHGSAICHKFISKNRNAKKNLTNKNDKAYQSKNIQTCKHIELIFQKATTKEKIPISFSQNIKCNSTKMQSNAV